MASKVPMQPRSDLWPEDRDIVFQVTKRGYEAVIDKRDAYEGGVEMEVVDEAFVRATFEELADIREGVEEDDDPDCGVDVRRREMLGFTGFEVELVLLPISGSCSSSISSSSRSSRSMPLLFTPSPFCLKAS